MEIRPFTKSDEPEVHALWNSVFPDETTFSDPDHPMQKNLHIHRHLFLVARSDSQLVGVIVGSYDGHHGWMHYLAVWPQYRRMGVATQLTKALEAELIHLGCDSLKLQVNAEHKDILDFYNNMGYDLTKTVSLEKKLIIH